MLYVVKEVRGATSVKLVGVLGKYYGRLQTRRIRRQNDAWKKAERNNREKSN